jgi:hypothetical protein
MNQKTLQNFLFDDQQDQDQNKNRRQLTKGTKNKTETNKQRQQRNTNKKQNSNDQIDDDDFNWDQEEQNQSQYQSQSQNQQQDQDYDEQDQQQDQDYDGQDQQQQGQQQQRQQDQQQQQQGQQQQDQQQQRQQTQQQKEQTNILKNILKKQLKNRKRLRKPYRKQVLKYLSTPLLDVMVGKEEDNQYETLQVENEEDITDTGEFGNILLELYNDDILEKLVYNFVKKNSNETIQRIINDPTLKKRIEYFKYDELRQSIKIKQAFIQKSKQRSDNWASRTLANQKKPEIQRQQNERDKLQKQYNNFLKQNNEYKNYVKLKEEQQKRLRSQAKDKKKEMKQIDYDKLLPLSDTAKEFLKKVDNDLDAYEILVNIQATKSSPIDAISKIDERLEIYRKFTYIIYLYLSDDVETENEKQYWNDQNYILQNLKYTDVFNENSDNAYNVFKKLFFDNVEQTFKPPKKITDEMREYIGDTNGLEDELYEVINFCPKNLRKKLDKNTETYKCVKDKRIRQEGSATRKKCARRGGKGGIPTKRLTDADLKRMGVAAEAARNLCLTEDEIKEAKTLMKKNNIVILEKFFQNIRKEHGQGFHPTKEKKVESGEKKKRGRKKNIQSGDTQQSTYKTGGRCKSRQVSEKEYNRLKQKYGDKFETLIAVKNRGKGSVGYRQNYVKVKNYKGYCLTYEEEEILKGLTGRQYQEKLEQYQEFKIGDDGEEKVRCKPITVSQEEYDRLKAQYPKEFDTKIKVKRGKGNGLKVKTADYNGNGICVTHDERRRLIASNNPDQIKKILQMAKKRSVSQRQQQQQQQQSQSGSTKEKKVGSGEKKKRGRKKKIQSGDDTQQNIKKRQQMRRKINEVKKKIQQQNAKVKQNKLLLQKKRQAQKKQNQLLLKKKRQAQKKQKQIIQLLSDSQYDDKSVLSDVSDVSL